MKKIAITCKAADLLPIDSLEDFQGSLKKISKKNLDKLKKRIIKDGINVPLFVWRVNDWCRILDGHQRLKVLLSLREDGYELPLVPVAYIEAENEKDARQKLLGITSQFGEFEIEELSEWVNEIDKDIAETLRFADSEVKIKKETEEEEIEKINVNIEDIVKNNIEKINDKTKHIVSFSGGKDSTAMLLMMIEKGIHIDEIIHFSMNDWEWEEMNYHIKKIKKEVGEITILKHEKLITEIMKEKGFPNMFQRWCTGIKISTINKYFKEKYPDGNYVQYIGIAKDEEYRIKKTKIFALFPLVKWGITEEKAIKYCKDRGYTWDGLYEKKPSNRLSCWCCPLQTKADLRFLRDEYPDKWIELFKMQQESRQSFRLNYKSLGCIEHDFWREDFKKC